MEVAVEWVHDECAGIYSGVLDNKGRITIPTMVAREFLDRTYATIRDSKNITIDPIGILYKEKRICRLKSEELERRVNESGGVIMDFRLKQELLDNDIINYKELAKNIFMCVYKAEERNIVYGIIENYIDHINKRKRRREKALTIEGYTMDKANRFVIREENPLRKEIQREKRGEIVIIGRGEFYIIGKRKDSKALQEFQLE